MKTKKEHFASTDENWENFWNWWEKQYNILMNELFGIKWVDTKWMSKRLLVILIVIMDQVNNILKFVRMNIN